MGFDTGRPAPGAASSRHYATHLKRLVLDVLARHLQARRQSPHTDACFNRTTERTSQACGGCVGGALSTVCAKFPPRKTHGSYYFHPPEGRCRVPRAGASRTASEMWFGLMKHAALPSSTAVNKSFATCMIRSPRTTAGGAKRKVFKQNPPSSRKQNC